MPTTSFGLWSWNGQLNCGLLRRRRTGPPVRALRPAFGQRRLRARRRRRRTDRLAVSGRRDARPLGCEDQFLRAGARRRGPRGAGTGRQRALGALRHAGRRSRRHRRLGRRRPGNPAPRPRAAGRDPLRHRRRFFAWRLPTRERERDRRAQARDASPDRARRLLEGGHPPRGQAACARCRGIRRARHARGRRGGVGRRGRRRGGRRPRSRGRISDAPLVRLVNSIIFQAAEEGASDVHFEPQPDSLVVRFRTDGVMHEVQRVPKRMTAGVITRLKVLAKLDIAERRKPQDGRISLSAAAAGRLLDIRVATLPTVDGEKIAMRLLDKSKTADARGARPRGGHAEHPLRNHQQAGRRTARHRPDRVGKVDDALLGADGDPSARDQHRDRRGSRRVPPPRRQPDPDQHQGRPDLRVGASIDPARRPRCRDGRRDPRRRDRQDLDRGGAHRPSCSRPCIQTTRPARSRA